MSCIKKKKFLKDLVLLDLIFIIHLLLPICTKKKKKKKKNLVDSDNRIENPKCKYDKLCYAYFVHVSWKKENTFVKNSDFLIAY